MSGSVFFGEPEVVRLYVSPPQLMAAAELVEGRGLLPGSRESAQLAQLLRTIYQHGMDGGQLPPAMGLRFAELVLLLAASSASPPDGGSSCAG